VLGGLLAVCSAATFAFNNASVRRGVLSGSVGQAMAITVPLGVPLFLLAALAAGHLGDVWGFPPRALAALALAGILHFVWGRYCNYRATRAIGTNLVAPVQQVNLIVTLSLAIWLLGEQLTPLRIFGIALILLGPSVTMRAKPKDPLEQPSERDGSDEQDPAGKPEKAVFRPRYAEGYFFALLSATGYGLSPILVRVGLENKGIGTSLAGGLVAYLAATSVMVLILMWPGNLRHALAVDRGAARWFTLSGFLVFLSQMFLYMAMSIAPVTVVSPINRLSILFRLYFSRWLNPKHEVFDGSVIVGTIVSLLGAMALSISTEAVQSILPLPAAVITLLNWHWPQ
jgi:drug/metabolite transporter (DMT)-like permease